MSVSLRGFLNGVELGVPDWLQICDSLGIDQVAVSLITGRCGSNIVAKTCRAYGFGRGGEPFNEKPVERWAEFGGRSEPICFLQRVIEPHVMNRRFYFQITPSRLADLVVSLPVLSKVETVTTAIFRRNIFAQALSYYNAHLSGVWHSYADSGIKTRPASSSVKSPREYAKTILQQELRAMDWLEDGTVPFYYEDIVSARYETMHQFLSAHGAPVDADRLAGAISADTVPSKLKREGYGRQYGAMRKEIAGFDHILSRRMACGYSSLNNDEILSAISEV